MTNPEEVAETIKMLEEADMATFFLAEDYKQEAARHEREMERCRSLQEKHKKLRTGFKAMIENMKQSGTQPKRT